jgi:hypothetical protein
MFYRIKIKLPKNKIKQYAEPLPVNVSELNDNDFMALITKYSDHKDLANNINKLKFNGQPINWSPSNYQIQLLTNFYLGNTIRLANQQENLGNQFANIIDGSNIIHYYLSPSYNRSILKAYTDLRINNNGRFALRINNKNIEYTEPFNQEYISQKNCSPEMFAEILRDIYKGRKTPLSRSQYEAMGSSYVYNGVLFKLPPSIDHNQIMMNKFILVSQEFFPYIKTENLTPDALKAFLARFINKTSQEYEHQRKKCPSYYENNIETFYITYENVNYRLYEYDRFLKNATPELKKVWIDFIKARPSISSIADQSLREIQEDKTLQWPEGIIFDTQYDSSDFKSFANAYLQKNYNDQIKTLIDAIILKNDENVRIEQENETYYFNLSTDFFLMNTDIQKQHVKDIESKKDYEFKLFKKDDVWICHVNKVSRNAHTPEAIQLFQKRSDPNQYSLDAVLLTNGKLSHIIEYDGSDHFGLREYSSIDGEKETKTNSFLNRMLADQLKSAYARSLNIPIIRVPDYNKYQKDQRWKDAFKLFILEKLNIIQTTPENINPGIREIPAYKIRKMIK